jgi:hypothetical protein
LWLKILFHVEEQPENIILELFHIVIDTIKVIIECIGSRFTPCKCLRIEMGFELLKNTILPEYSHTEEVDRDTAIIRIDLEKHVNYGHIYFTFYHEMVHVLSSY